MSFVYARVSVWIVRLLGSGRWTGSIAVPTENVRAPLWIGETRFSGDVVQLTGREAMHVRLPSLARVGQHF
jgi:hypothetical protein